MFRVGLWNVTDRSPQKLARGDIEIEISLEGWIESDPSLLEAGLTIVGRQLQVEGGRLDLLAVDTEGRWAVVELKRGKMYRDTLTQALDYAASVASMPQEELLSRVNDYRAGHPSDDWPNLKSVIDESYPDQLQMQPFRDVRVCLVGTTADPGLERLTKYLADAYHVPVTVVTFQVFDVGDGQRVLLRQLSESEIPEPSDGKRSILTVDGVCRRADAAESGQPFRRIRDAAMSHGLYPRPFKNCIMYTPPADKTRTLFTVWIQPNQPGHLKVWIGPEGFADFYSISESDAESVLGPQGWRNLSEDDVDEFVQNLDRLFQRIDAALE